MRRINAGMVTLSLALGILASAMLPSRGTAKILSVQSERDIIGGAGPCNNTVGYSFACGLAGPNGNCPTGLSLGLCVNLDTTTCFSLTTQPNGGCTSKDGKGYHCVEAQQNKSCGTVKYGIRPPGGANCATGNCPGDPQGCGATLVMPTSQACEDDGGDDGGDDGKGFRRK